MKVAAQTLLVIFLVIFFSLGLIASTIKFQLLNYNFWTKTLTSHNVYSNLSTTVTNSINSQIKTRGGDKNDISIFTDLITPANMRDFLDKNIFNVINFMNGNAKELVVFVPINKIPSDLLPKSIIGLKEEMTIGELGTRFNIVGLESLPLKNISLIGLYDYYLLMISVAVFIIFLVLLILSVGSGGRYIAPGIGLILSGIVSILFFQFGVHASEYIVQNYSTATNLNKVLVFGIAPSVLSVISQTWFYTGIGLILLGIIFILFKRKEVRQRIPLNG